MDLFVTKIALKNEVKKEQIYCLIKKWLIDSPHYGIKEIIYNNEEFKEISFGNQSLKIVNKIISDKDILAIRFTNVEKDNVWRTDFIFSAIEGSVNFAIKLSCEKNDYSSVLPKIHKPHIIKMLFDEGYCKDCGLLPITDQPVYFEEKDLDICGKIMMGAVETDLPVVYVSYDSYSGTGYDVDEKNLAIKLSGIAHVVVEPNKQFSLKLKELSKDRNAHNGYIGVYFSGAKYKEIVSYRDYFKNGKLDKNAFSDAIRTLIQQALLNHSGADDLTWDKVLVEYHKVKYQNQKTVSTSAEEEYSKLLHAADIENKEYEELLKASDAERDELKIKVNSLIGQLDAQSAQIESLKKKLEQKMTGIIQKDEIDEFYSDEVYDCLLSLLSQCIKKLPKDTRAYEITQAILKINLLSNVGKRVFDEIKDSLNEKSLELRRSKLEKCGFTVKKESHDKVIFHNDNRYMFTLANSPSDHRDSENLFSDMMKKLDIYKKFF